MCYRALLDEERGQMLKTPWTSKGTLKLAGSPGVPSYWITSEEMWYIRGQFVLLEIGGAGLPRPMLGLQCCILGRVG